MPSATLIISMFFAGLASLFLSTLANAEEDKVKPKIELCQPKKVATRGRPNRIRAMASMNAVISWINLAKKQHGEEYALWHVAINKKISCEKIKDSDYHICFAGGKPCKVPPKEPSKAAQGKINQNKAAQ